MIAGLRLIRDSRGCPSWAHTLAVPSLILMTLRFLVGGLTIGDVTVPAWTAADYTLAAGIWLGFLAQREYVEKKNGGAPAPGGSS